LLAIADEVMRIIPGDTFHTDHSNHPRPPKATMLFAVELPSSGGDTQYVNMHDDRRALASRRVT
jgi:taurine dioxygenase